MVLSLPHPLIFPLINQCDRCLVPLAEGALGCWKAQVYPPWGRNSVQGLALPKVEARGYPGHPPLLSDTVVNR